MPKCTKIYSETESSTIAFLSIIIKNLMKLLSYWYHDTTADWAKKMESCVSVKCTDWDRRILTSTSYFGPVTSIKWIIIE